jgi:hypothetical protein
VPPIKIGDDDDDDDYSPSNRTRESGLRKIRDAIKREDIEYERSKRRSRAAETLKKTVKVGAGLAVGYGIARALHGKKHY